MVDKITPSPSLDGVSDLMADHSEQADIELVYIKEGNQIVGNALTSLTKALNVTQSALNLLQLLQSFHNNISVSAPSAFPFNFKTGQPSSTLYTFLGFGTKGSAQNYLSMHRASATETGNVEAWALNQSLGSPITNMPTSTYQALYLFISSAYYSNPINPHVIPVSGELDSVLAARKSLAAQITALSAQTSAMQKGNGSLLYSLKTVYSELPTTQSGLNNWILDNYSSPEHAASAGAIQNNLTTAITSAQSLNNTQQEQVREFLFVFQEYYQSASSILSQITQIIQNMATKISQ